MTPTPAALTESRLQIDMALCRMDVLIREIENSANDLRAERENIAKLIDPRRDEAEKGSQTCSR